MVKCTTMLKWYFPPTGGGVTQGFNDGSQEFFRSNAWEQTIREIIQNSLDAVDDRRNGPVIINISEIMISASEMGADDLAGHISKALERTRKLKSITGNKFYENALKVLNQNEIKVLSITDTNTTGLVNGKWDALIYDEGTSSKDGMNAAGGSFGIGKNAPYVVSDLKTVCYSTRYLGKGRIEKFIARCKISAHENPDELSNDMLQHIGFGTKSELKKNVRPLPTEGNDIHQAFRLDKSGSGIFIIGFNPQLKNWIKVAKKSIAHNFFVAIHEKKLEIHINSEPINYETLDSIFEDDRKKEPTRHYYHIIRDNMKKEIVEGDLGKFTVQINIDDEDAPNQIAYVNRRGMMVTDKRTFKENPFHTAIGKGWAKYAVVVMANDDATDMKIRMMEPPNHQSIEYRRINDHNKRDSMEEQLRDIKNKITDIINNAISESNHEHDINLSELADILPFPDDSGKEGVEQDKINRSLDHHPIESSTSSHVVDDGSDSGTVPGGGTDVRGSGTALPGRKVSSKGTLILHRQRIVRSKDILRVAFTSRQNDGKSVCFGIKPVGEERKNETMIPIISAHVETPSNFTIKTNKNHITMTPKYDERIVMDLKIPQTKSYTGYEIVEIVSNKKSSKGNKK